MPIEVLIVLLILYSQSNRELGHLNRTIQMTNVYVLIGFCLLLLIFVWQQCDRHKWVCTHRQIFQGNNHHFFCQFQSSDSYRFIRLDGCVQSSVLNIAKWPLNCELHTHTHTPILTQKSANELFNIDKFIDQLTYIALFQWNVSTSSNYIWFVFVLFEVDEISVCLWMAAWNRYTWWSFVQSNWSSSSNININVIIMDFCEMESV